MASTPELGCIKNVKSSPFGSGISKSLLTPCRRVGLSRKWKSASKTSEKEGNYNFTVTDSPVIPSNYGVSQDKNNCINTPVCSRSEIENSKSKRFRKNTKDKLCRKKLEPAFPCDVEIEEDAEMETAGVQVLLKSIEDNTNKQNAQTIVVKALVHNSDLIRDTIEEDSILNEKKHKTVTDNLCTINSNCEVILRKLSENEIKEKSIRSSGSDESDEIVRIKRKRRKNILSDDEDDFFVGFKSTKKSLVKNIVAIDKTNLNKIIAEDPNTSLHDKNTLEMQKDLEKRSNSNKDVLDEKISVNIIQSEFNVDSKASLRLESNEDEQLALVPTDKVDRPKNIVKSTITLDKKVSDEHFKPDRSNKSETSSSRATNNSNDRRQTDLNGSSKLSDNTKISRKNEKKSVEKTYNLEKKLSEKLINGNSVDEDAFTSTPEQDKNEKKYLIDRIKSMERKVKDKRRKLQDLQQAAIYMKKHDVDELRKLKEIWKRGCVMGLQELLDRFRRQFPTMNMKDLLEKSNISADIAVKLSLELE